jgi:hypothetical protein
MSARGAAACGPILRLVDAAHERHELALPGCDHAEIVEQQHTGLFRAGAEELSRLEGRRSSA